MSSVASLGPYALSAGTVSKGIFEFLDFDDIAQVSATCEGGLGIRVAGKLRCFSIQYPSEYQIPMVLTSVCLERLRCFYVSCENAHMVMLAAVAASSMTHLQTLGFEIDFDGAYDELNNLQIATVAKLLSKPLSSRVLTNVRIDWGLEFSTEMDETAKTNALNALRGNSGIRCLDLSGMDWTSPRNFDLFKAVLVPQLQLEEISLFSCGDGRPDPEDLSGLFCALRSMDSLARLSLRPGLSLESAHLASLVAVPMLLELSLDGNDNLFADYALNGGPVFPASLREVHLCSCGLHSERACEAVATNLRQLVQLETLSLRWNRMPVIGLRQIARSIRNARQLKRFDILGCELGSEVATAVATILSEHPSLEDVQLNGNRFLDVLHVFLQPLEGLPRLNIAMLDSPRDAEARVPFQVALGSRVRFPVPATWYAASAAGPPRLTGEPRPFASTSQLATPPPAV